jgi:hypothetical protein
MTLVSQLEQLLQETMMVIVGHAQIALILVALLERAVSLLVPSSQMACCIVNIQDHTMTAEDRNYYMLVVHLELLAIASVLSALILFVPSPKHSLRDTADIVCFHTRIVRALVKFQSQTIISIHIFNFK